MDIELAKKLLSARGVWGVIVVIVLLLALKEDNPLSRLVASSMRVAGKLLHKKGLPAPERGHIGILLAVRTEQDEQRCYVTDLEQYMANTLKRLGFDVCLELLTTPRELTVDVCDAISRYGRLLGSAKRRGESLQDVKSKEFDRLHARVKAGLYLCGAVKVRRVEGKERCLMQLEGVLRSPPGRREARPAFSSFMDTKSKTHTKPYFGEISIPEIDIDPGDEVRTVQAIAAGWAGVIAIVFAEVLSASNDVLNAVVLMESLLDHGELDPPSRARIESRLLQCCSVILRSCIDRREYVKADKWLVKALKYHPRDWELLTMAAYLSYVLRGDIGNAIALCLQAGEVAPPGESLWTLDLAFLQMRKHDFETALARYDAVTPAMIEKDIAIVRSIIVFCKKELRRDAQAIEIHFILGYLYYRCRRTDLSFASRSRKSLSLFCQLAEPDAVLYQPLLNRACSYLRKLEN